MGEIIVEKAGLFDTIQDLGRVGYQAYGVAQAGAMDPFAYQLANILVGNSRDAPALEITWFGPALRFTSAAIVALTGATFPATLSGKPVLPWSSFTVQAGDVLTFGAASSGCRAYLAVQQGFRVESMMGSTSTYVKGELGGWQGRALQSGDRIPYGPAVETVANETHGKSSSSPLSVRRNFSLAPALQPKYENHTVLRVVCGPQENAFTSKGMNGFLTQSYKVSHQMDRMGVRLEGQAIEHVSGADILSDSIPFGGIQVPANGQPIILMADRQTTGGYPKIATVISVDLPQVAQLRPGHTVAFQAIPVEEAQALYREQEKTFKRLEMLLK